jgi:hypothetical protein
MALATTIEALDKAKTLFVLRDDRGKAIGTGTKEVMQVLAFIVNQSRRMETSGPVDHLPTRAAVVRSALVF